MAYFDGTPMSCGLCEMYEFQHYGTNQSADEIGKDLIKQFRESAAYECRKYPFLLWSDITTYSYGEVAKSPGVRFAEYIKKRYGAKSLQKSESRVNDNSGNTIAVWVWRVPARGVYMTKREQEKFLNERGERDWW